MRPQGRGFCNPYPAEHTPPEAAVMGNGAAPRDFRSSKAARGGAVAQRWATGGRNAIAFGKARTFGLFCLRRGFCDSVSPGADFQSVMPPAASFFRFAVPEGHRQERGKKGRVRERAPMPFSRHPYPGVTWKLQCALLLTKFDLLLRLLCSRCGFRVMALAFRRGVVYFGKTLICESVLPPAAPFFCFAIP